VIDHAGLPSVGWAAAGVVLSAMVGSVLLMLASGRVEDEPGICQPKLDNQA